MANRRYQTLGMSSGIPKGYVLEHKNCESVKIKVMSEVTSEMEVTYQDKTKERLPNLDKTDIAIRLHEGIKVSYDKKDRPKGLGWNNLGKRKGKKFISIYDAWKADVDFLTFYEKAETE